MGDFDDRISIFKRQRELARRDLEEIQKGARRLWNGQEMTDQIRKRAEKIVLDLDAIIAAYEAHNAEGA